MNDAIRELSQAYEHIQHLDIEPTRKNLEILLEAMHAMQNAYKVLEMMSGKQETKEDANGNADAE